MKEWIMNIRNAKKLKFWMVAIIIAVITISAIILVNHFILSKAVKYENKKYGFALMMSKEFADEVTIVEDENVFYFISKDIRDLDPEMIMGVVGRIEVYDKQKISRINLEELEDAYNLKYIGENEEYFIGLSHATDVQIPPDASIEIRENYKNLENEFDKVVAGIEITAVVADNNKSPSPVNSETETYSIIIDKQTILLGDTYTAEIYSILGKPFSDTTEILSNSADTFEGSKIRTLEYESIIIKLFSPKGERDNYWVMSMELLDNYVKTQNGISIGSTLQDVKNAYSNIEIVPDGNQDSSILTYRIVNRIEYKYLEFIVTDGIVTTIKLYVENP